MNRKNGERMECPYGIHDQFLEKKIHKNENVRVCRRYDMVVWKDDECRRCIYGKIYRMADCICRIVSCICE